MRLIKLTTGRLLAVDILAVWTGRNVELCADHEYVLGFPPPIASPTWRAR